MKTRTSLILLALAVLALGLAGQANAAVYFTDAGGPLPWDIITANWATTPGGPLYDQLWTGGDAHFEGASGTVNVATPGGVTSITFDVTNYILTGGTITMTGAGINSTVAGASTQDINSVLAGTVGLTLNGAGTSNTLRTTLNLGGVNTVTGSYSVGSTSAYNTLNIANGGTLAGNATGNGSFLNIGSSTFGGNQVTISTPGNSTTPTFKAHNLILGGSSADNKLTVSGGAYYRLVTGNNVNFLIGQNAGADRNVLLITGATSTLTRAAAGGSPLVVGVGGSYNEARVEDGGTLIPRRLFVGTGAGTHNSALVTGGNSNITINEGTNSVFQIGSAASTDNYVSVESGGTLFLNGTGGNRNFDIGSVNGADRNYLRVTGSTSTMTFTTNNPLSLGGTWVNGAATDSTAADNHLDVYGGATATFNAVYLQGVTSKFNLGNGTGISTATVGKSSNYATPGVSLAKADSRLVINSGKLLAGTYYATPGALVSGAGQVQLNGPAYFSTTYAGSTIDSVIYGTGSLTKEGSGTLKLTAANLYSGDTTVSLGTLEVTQAFFADASSVYISGVLNLNTGGATDTIAALYFGTTPQAAGTWGSTASAATNKNDTYFSVSGTGILDVVPEPATLALMALGGLGLILSRKRR